MSTLSTPANTKMNTAAKESKFITFQLGGYRFALPSQDVLKIMVTPAPEQGGMVSMGLVQLGQYSIQILALQTILKLEQPADDRDTTDSSFLIILQAKQGLWGIVVDQSPDLMNISNSALKPVPTSKRIAGALKGISHIVTYESVTYESVTYESVAYESVTDDSASPEDRQILLILDLHKLLSISQAEGNEPVKETIGDRPSRSASLASTKANTKTAKSQ